uniref:PB1 domain-containing protein n=2 Tax=Nicotiana TaxID=4085 RepID=A0A1S4D2J6_TOBAC|nr:PREDICTED: uncharacterized protein LOC104242446 [Nicotiana sylvestris]XP_016507548.1 PREDICTED: uncharacterized protein LOC107825232 [Nicotiana tabacum]
MENQKVKLMCSYGGKIQLRPHDHQLSYVGGDTKILTVDRNVKFADMVAKLNSLCNINAEICIKYQLPGEDLDALVSLVDDDDVEQMMIEYDRMQKVTTKTARLRLFLFYPIRLPVSPSTPDFLFGFDKEYNPNSNPNPSLTPTADLLQLQIPGILAAPENSVMDTPKNQESGGGTVRVPKISASEIVRDSSSLLVKNVQTQQGLRESHVTGGAYGNAVQMVFGVPMMMTGGYHTTGFGQFGVQGLVGGGGQYMDQPVYNFAPATAMTSVMVPPDQKMMVSTADTLSREIKS